MNMPEFTAEASLQLTNNFYPVVNQFYITEFSSRAIPSLVFNWRLQPDGTIIYRKKCVTKYAWVCDSQGCRRIPYQECTYYPE